MLFQDFNGKNKDEVAVLLQKCCGSQKWKEEVLKNFPFSTEGRFIEVLNNTWYNECSAEDWKEAFMHHPEIGDLSSLQEKYGTSRDIAEKEQQGVNAASEETLKALMSANKEYKEKFGFIFIVFATGKSAGEMLELLHSRLGNNAGDEIRVAMGEQQKIMMKRLKDQVTDLNLAVSQVTTHILDTSAGLPAAKVVIRFFEMDNGDAYMISQGLTNADGRIPDLLPPGRILKAGVYKMHFSTGEYFHRSAAETFFPFAEITFKISGPSHYHIPLLISPFGFTTYRGS